MPPDAPTLQQEEPRHLGRGAYVRNDIYTRQDVFDREIRLLFAKCWNFACHESEIPEAGAFRTVEIAGLPIVVWRESADRVRAFLNVCRHRGVPPVRGSSGTLSSFRCIYHLWTYDPRRGGELSLDAHLGVGAELTGVPVSSGYSPTTFRKEDFPLQEVRADTSCGMVFVCLDDSAPGLPEYLGAFAPHLSAVVTDDLEVFHYHEADLATNWKLFSDNNRELYHIFLHYLNRQTSGFSGKDQDRYAWQYYDHGHLVFGSPTFRSTEYQKAGYDDEADVKQRHPLPGVEVGAQCIYYVFPDLVLNVRSNCLRIDRMVPRGPGRTVVEFRGLGLKGDSEDVRWARQQNHNLVWGPFGRNLPEDALAVEKQWETLDTSLRSWSVICRDMGGVGMDDGPLRQFYSEWSAWVGLEYDTGQERAVGAAVRGGRA